MGVSTPVQQSRILFLKPARRSSVVSQTTSRRNPSALLLALRRHGRNSRETAQTTVGVYHHTLRKHTRQPMPMVHSPTPGGRIRLHYRRNPATRSLFSLLTCRFAWNRTMYVNVSTTNHGEAHITSLLRRTAFTRAFSSMTLHRSSRGRWLCSRNKLWSHATTRLVAEYAFPVLLVHSPVTERSNSLAHCCMIRILDVMSAG